MFVVFITGQSLHAQSGVNPLTDWVHSLQPPSGDATVETFGQVALSSHGQPNDTVVATADSTQFDSDPRSTLDPEHTPARQPHTTPRASNGPTASQSNDDVPKSGRGLDSPICHTGSSSIAALQENYRMCKTQSLQAQAAVYTQAQPASQGPPPPTKSDAKLPQSHALAGFICPTCFLPHTSVATLLEHFQTCTAGTQQTEARSREPPTSVMQSQQGVLLALSCRSSEIAGRDPAVARALRSMNGLSLPDKSVASCLHCGAEFGVFNRQHHCRGCGLVFCGGCTQWRVQLPAAFQQVGTVRVCIICQQLGSEACKNLCPQQLHAVVTLAEPVLESQNRACNGNEDNTRDAQTDKSAEGIEAHFKFFDLSPLSASLKELKAQFQKRLRQAHPDTRETSSGPSTKHAASSLEDIKARFAAAKAWLNGPRTLPTASRTKNRALTSTTATATINTADTACTICFRPFTVAFRRHHCRKCGQAVCGVCSPAKRQLEEYGFEGIVRHCTLCITDPGRFDRTQQPTLRLADRIRPPGKQYLSDLEVTIDAQCSDLKTVTIVCKYAPRRSVDGGCISAAAADDELGSYILVVERRTKDIQWLQQSLVKAGHSRKSIPPLRLGQVSPKTRINRLLAVIGGKKAQVQRMDKENAMATANAIRVFLSALATHPMFRRNQWLWALLSLDELQLGRLQKLPHSHTDQIPVSNDTSDLIEAFTAAHPLRHWIQLLIERDVVNLNLAELAPRRHRLAQRASAASDRKQTQHMRSAAVSPAAKTQCHLESMSGRRRELCAAQLQSGKQRRVRQDSTPKLVCIDRDDDEEEFSQLCQQRNEHTAAFSSLCTAFEPAIRACNDEFTANGSAHTASTVNKCDWLPPLHRCMLENENFVRDPSEPGEPCPRLLEDMERRRGELFKGVPQLTGEADAEGMELALELERLETERDKTLPRVAEVIELGTAQRDEEVAESEACATVRSEERRLRRDKEEVVNHDLELRESRLRERAERQGKRAMDQNSRRDAAIQRDCAYRQRCVACEEAASVLTTLSQVNIQRTRKARTMLDQQRGTVVVLNFPRDAEVEERLHNTEQAAQYKQLSQAQLRQATADVTQNEQAMQRLQQDASQVAHERVANSEGNPRTVHETVEEPPRVDTFNWDVWCRRQTVDRGLSTELERLLQEHSDVTRDVEALRCAQSRVSQELRDINRVDASCDRLASALKEEDELFQNEQAICVEKKQRVVNALDAAVAVQLKRTSQIAEVRAAAISRIESVNGWKLRANSLTGASQRRCAVSARVANELNGIERSYEAQIEQQECERARLFFPEADVPPIGPLAQQADRLVSERCSDAGATQDLLQQVSDTKEWIAARRQQLLQLSQTPREHTQLDECWQKYTASLRALPRDLASFHCVTWFNSVKQRVDAYTQHHSGDLSRLLQQVDELLGEAGCAAGGVDAACCALRNALSGEEEQEDSATRLVSQVVIAQNESKTQREAKEHRLVHDLQVSTNATSTLETELSRVRSSVFEASSFMVDLGSLQRAAGSLREKAGIAKSARQQHVTTSDDVQTVLHMLGRLQHQCSDDCKTLRVSQFDRLLGELRQLNETLRHMQTEASRLQPNLNELGSACQSVHPDDTWLQSFRNEQQQAVQQLEQLAHGTTETTDEVQRLSAALQNCQTFVRDCHDLVTEVQQIFYSEIDNAQSHYERLRRDEERRFVMLGSADSGTPIDCVHVVVSPVLHAAVASRFFASLCTHGMSLFSCVAFNPTFDRREEEEEERRRLERQRNLERFVHTHGQACIHACILRDHMHAIYSTKSTRVRHDCETRIAVALESTVGTAVRVSVLALNTSRHVRHGFDWICLLCCMFAILVSMLPTANRKKNGSESGSESGSENCMCRSCSTKTRL